MTVLDSLSTCFARNIFVIYFIIARIMKELLIENLQALMKREKAIFIMELGK